MLFMSTGVVILILCHMLSLSCILDQVLIISRREVLVLVLCCVTSFHSCETAQYAPQRMEHSPGARRVVTAHPWSTSKVCDVAGSRDISTKSTCEESSGGLRLPVLKVCEARRQRKWSRMREHE